MVQEIHKVTALVDVHRCQFVRAVKDHFAKTVKRYESDLGDFRGVHLYSVELDIRTC